ncbi:Nucleotidylyl transferase [Rhodofomes roseus]|uniref:Nucleotidylyl transferase n=1 Tax=Rhodofomes roseus TaxID=34475 RepID=A0ABQ8K3Z3_9APHY|nr:Nucleotidylyl transferase [Rhodofomes roseus]KAH9831563.1 Nucleotidylyl transferase [Rhodofomes roseus]
MASFASLIDRVRGGHSPVELVYASHPAWPHPPRPAPTHGTLRVAVLDSSFNPPSRAHLALANAPRPAFSDEDPSDGGDYDAKLLLLSVRNADKQLAPGDAAHTQRLAMMILLARAVLRVPSAAVLLPSSDGAPGGPAAPGVPHDNVAVAIIDEPTFVGKSSVLLSYLRHRLSAPPASLSAPPHPESTPISQPPVAPASPDVPRPQLTFLVGTDTLERLFAPRYYPSPVAMQTALRRFLSAHPAGDDARVVCARRALASPEADPEEDKLKAAIREIAEEGRVLLVDIPEELRAVSSTAIRRDVRSGDAWRAMVSPAVAEYVVEHDLYRA